MKALENAHKQEIKDLINKWNQIIMPNFENEAQLLQLELKKKQQNELEAFQGDLGNDTSKVHYTSDVLNMSKKAEILGQQGFYSDAKKLKKKVKEAKNFEDQKFKMQRK